MKGWSNFRSKSLELLKENYEYVVVSDISAFYENINISRLISDLKAFNVDAEILDQLMQCLYRWAEPRGRGIPQGYSPSAILSELYLNSIDRLLIFHEISHLRYADDMRIFCKNKDEAVKALHTLTKLYREKGLNLQTAKSKIIKKDELIEELEYINNIIQELKSEIEAEFSDKYEIENPYSTPEEIKILLKKLNLNSIESDDLRRGFILHFLKTEEIKFDKSLFTTFSIVLLYYVILWQLNFVSK